MIIRHLVNYVEAFSLVMGLDKRKIGNKELGRERVYAKGYIDLDNLVSKGYPIETVKAMLGQDFTEKSILGHLRLMETITGHKEHGNIKMYLNIVPSLLLFKEIMEARLFFTSYLYSEKYELTFRDMVEAFFEYINWDVRQLKKLTYCSRSDGRSIDRFIRNGNDPFEELLHESDCLWNDMLPSFRYSTRHDIPTTVFFFENENVGSGTEDLLTPVQDLIKDKTYLYKEMPKRRLLERISVTREDVLGTPYEYLFDKKMDELLLSDTQTDFAWKWQSNMPGSVMR